jgi:hypothetical protein
MASTKKTINKKKTAVKPAAKAVAPTSGRIAADKFKKIGDDLVAALKEVRGRYQKLDQETKKKIITGVAGTLALFAGIRAVKKMAKKKRKK